MTRPALRAPAGIVLARLKKKYRANPGVMDVLDELEDKVELPDKAAARRFCQRLRQPVRP